MLMKVRCWFLLRLGSMVVFVKNLVIVSCDMQSSICQLAINMQSANLKVKFWEDINFPEVMVTPFD